MPRNVTVPTSSHVNASDLGKRAHTNVRFIRPSLSPDEAPPFSGYGYETPASLACIYRVVTPIPGCNPNSTTNTPSGGSQSIAIVDAFDDPNAAADLSFFSSQFGLPYSDANFTVVYAGGSEPQGDPTGGWELEESLDIEYTHAMAPNAHIYLVEANDNSFLNLFGAVQVASNLVNCGQANACPAGSKGKGEVSMSWGGSEFPEEVSLDGLFTAPNVVYFAASGDAPGVIYPCSSPNVVCAGGTSDSRSYFTGDLQGQISWAEAGGGASFYEPIPSYQAANPFIASQLGGARGVPDMSADSNPDTGMWVIDTFPYEGQFTGWFIVGGTSAATPILAGVVNAGGFFAKSTSSLLTYLYPQKGAGVGAQNFTDITYGGCGPYASAFSSYGWDLCTGLGTPRNLAIPK